jgi:hypothetical protein
MFYRYKLPNQHQSNVLNENKKPNKVFEKLIATEVEKQLEA